MLVSVYTSCLFFQINTVKPPLFLPVLLPFSVSVFLAQSQGPCVLFGRTVLHEFVYLVSKSSKSLRDKRKVHK
jgi:hypothetical protein